MVYKLREAEGLTSGKFCEKLESIINAPNFQKNYRELLEKYPGYTKLRPDYIRRWEDTGRFPENPVVRQALCVLTQKTIGELFFPNEKIARSILMNEFYCSKSQNVINDIANSSGYSIFKIDLYDTSIPILMSYIAEVLAINSNQSITHVDFEGMLDSKINMTELLDNMQKSCQITAPTTKQLLRNATINACHYILKSLVPFF